MPSRNARVGILEYRSGALRGRGYDIALFAAAFTEKRPQPGAWLCEPRPGAISQRNAGVAKGSPLLGLFLVGGAASGAW